MNDTFRPWITCLSLLIFCFLYSHSTTGQTLEISFTANPPLCGGFSTGSITAHVSGGNPPYTYLWSNGSSNNPITNLPAGWYSLTVSDQDGTTAIDSIELTSPPPLQVPITVTACTPPGSMTANPAGGVPPYSISWNTGDTTLTISNLPLGQYCITLIDANNCAFINCQYIGMPMSGSVESTPAYCNDPSGGGTAVANVSGGVSPFTYTWSNGMTGKSIDSLPAGPISVTVTGYNGCNIVLEDTIDLIENPLGITIAETPPQCQGDSTGALKADAPGGYGMLSFVWNTGDSSRAIFDLPAGEYWVSVVDEMGCTGVDSIELDYLSHLKIELLSKNPICFESETGRVQAKPTGGIEPYSYQWNTGDTTQAIEDLPAGVYSVTVTDGLGCSVVDSVMLEDPPQILLEFTISHASHCGAGDGKARVEVIQGGSAPYSYLWSNGKTTQEITNVPAGTYVVTVTSNEGCIAIDSTTIGQPNTLSVTITGNSIVCGNSHNAILTANVNYGTAPYSYVWNNGDTTKTINNLGPGVYKVTVTSAEGCTGSSSKTIFSSPGILLSVDSVPISCHHANDGMLIVNHTGGIPPFGVLWSTGATSQSIQDLPPGNYGVTITDFAGCTASAHVTLTEPAPFSVKIDASQGNCNPQTDLTAVVAGGTPPYTYLWSTGDTSTTIQTGMAGTYGVTVYDSRGCNAFADIVIQDFPEILLDVLTTNETCDGAHDGNATAAVSGGTPPFKYLWNTGSTNFQIDNLPPGDYTVTVSDAAGCTRSEVGTILPGAPLMVSIDAPPFVCGNELTTAQAKAGPEATMPVTFDWSNGQSGAVANGLAAGLYSVTLTDAKGCMGTNSVEIEQGGLFSVDAELAHVNCHGGADGMITLSLSGSMPLQLTWENGSNTTTRSGLIAGTYYLTVTETTSGCKQELSFTIEQPEALSLILQANDGHCGEPGTIVPQVSGGVMPYYYAWSNGTTDSVLISSLSGNYGVTITDQHGCTIVGDEGIQVSAAPSCQIELIQYPESPAIPNGVLEVQVFDMSDPITYQWSNGQSGSQATNLSPGQYEVTLSDAIGCSTACIFSIPDFGTTGDFIWWDENENGIQDTGESGIAEVQINVEGLSKFDQPIAKSTTTDSQGRYLFYLPPGEYRLKFDLPDGMLFTKPFQGTDAAIDSNADEDSGLTQWFTLEAGDSRLDLDAGLVEENPCKNFTEAGTICCDQVLCAPGKLPARIEEASPAAGGSGQSHYQWYQSHEAVPFDPTNVWEPIAGQTGVDLEPPIIRQTTYFVRVAWRENCQTTPLVSNVVTVKVDSLLWSQIEGPTQVCKDEWSAFSLVPHPDDATVSWMVPNGSELSNQSNDAVAVIRWDGIASSNLTVKIQTDGCVTSDTIDVAITDDPTFCQQKLKLTGQLTDEEEHDLRWEWPENDITNVQFFLERSFEGAPFELLKAIDSTWVVGDTHFFKSLHPAKNFGTYYYRLKSMRTDGTVEFSNAVILHNSPRGSLVVVYPNPVSTLLTMDVIDRYDAQVDIQILNSMGRVILYKKLNTDHESIDVSDWSNGVYFFKIFYDSKLVKVVRIVKI